MAAIKPVTFRDLIDAIATLPIINLPENLSQLSSNKSQSNCNKGRGIGILGAAPRKCPIKR
jgi:hypothetical protein